MSIGHCRGCNFRIGSLVILQEYEFDKSSNGAQENLRIRLELLIEIQATGSPYYYLVFFRDIRVSFWMGSHSYPKIKVEGPFQAGNDDC